MEKSDIRILNERIKKLFLLIKDFKKVYSDLIHKKNILRNILGKEIYDKDYLDKVENEIITLKSRLYINIGKIKNELSEISELLKSYRGGEELKEEAIDRIKQVIYPFIEVPEKEFSSEFLKIENELKKAERIPQLDKIKRIYSFKKVKKEEIKEKPIKKILIKRHKIIREINIFNFLLFISDILFNKLSYFLLEKMPYLHYKIRILLFKGRLFISPTKFLSFLLFIISLLSLLTIFLFFLFLKNVLLVLIPAVILTSPLFLYLYIEYRNNKIKKDIEKNLPFVSIHILSLLQTGLDIENCLRLVANIEEYGFLSLELKRLVNLLDTGISISDAIEEIRDTTVSERFKEFLDELLLTIRSGRSLKDFFVIHTEKEILLYKTELDKLNQLMKTFSDLYVGIILTVPMILISIGILVSTISPEIFGISVLEFLKVITLIVLPLINIGFLVFVSKMEI